MEAFGAFEQVELSPDSTWGRDVDQKVGGVQRSLVASSAEASCNPKLYSRHMQDRYHLPRLASFHTVEAADDHALARYLGSCAIATGLSKACALHVGPLCSLPVCSPIFFPSCL